MTTFTGTKGNDNFTGTSGGDTFDLSQGGNDTANGAGGNDVFIMGGALNADDHLDGGTGNDTVVLDGNYSTRVAFNATTMVNVETLKLTATFDYRFATSDATVAAGGTLVVDGSSLGTSDVLSLNGSRETNGVFHVTGGAGADAFIDGAGNDVFAGGAGNDLVYLSSGGHDTVQGGDGNDTIKIGGTLNASDKIDGGAGTDVVQLDGDYSQQVVFGSGTMVSVEHLNEIGSFTYRLALNAETVTAGHTLDVDATGITGGHGLSLDAASNTAGVLNVVGSAGNDAINGGAGDDVVSLGQGGSDRFYGRDGNDTVTVGAAFNAGDVINGGAGTDTLNFIGAYANGIALTAGTVTDVEHANFLGAFNYNVTVGDGVQTFRMYFDASGLSAGHSLTLDASATSSSNAEIIVTGSAGDDHLVGGDVHTAFELSSGGNDTVTGGARDDIIDLGATFTAADSINGGGGVDTLEFGSASGTHIVLGPNTLTNVEHVYVVGPASLTIASDTVAAGSTFTVAGDPSSRLVFDGSADTNVSSHINVTGGTGDDVLNGGSGNDVIIGGAGGSDTLRGGDGNDTIKSLSSGEQIINGGTGEDLIDFTHTHVTAQDIINGGAGNDTLYIANGVTFGATSLYSIQTLYIQTHDVVTTNDANVAAGQVMSVHGSGLNFDGSAETDGLSISSTMVSTVRVLLSAVPATTRSLWPGLAIPSLAGAAPTQSQLALLMTATVFISVRPFDICLHRTRQVRSSTTSNPSSLASRSTCHLSLAQWTLPSHTAFRRRRSTPICRRSRQV
ncbi:MAG TPA: hypothetical protein VGG10_02365 [Rhizomicrobium sp.]|jgi:Ca2+-binding RTX toxin-like protein